ncbi:MAG TPA: hypothetical protein PKL84_09930, partial [Candidatus Hydrogenedentes bacterium]|nr:hypothetical protein [Candidatus Hydrogenedentota bacterium]
MHPDIPNHPHQGNRIKIRTLSRLRDPRGLRDLAKGTALKGPDKTAQGNALGSGMADIKRSPERAKHDGKTPRGQPFGCYALAGLHIEARTFS